MILRKKQSEFVLALGGGGARGLAHVGVLKVLQRERIGIKGIVGTSMGAIVGAMFAHCGNALEVEELFRKFLASQFHEKFGKTFFILSENPSTYQEPKKILDRLGQKFIYIKAASKRGIFTHDILKDALSFLIPDIQFKDLKIPFVCVSTDLVSGREIVFRNGRVLTAVIASSLIPGIVEPLKSGTSILIDGSTTSTVPVTAARKTFSGKIIAVDVSMELRRDGEPSTAFDVALRANEITNYHFNRALLSESDVVIRPKVGRTNWANFDKLDEMIRAGETATRKSLTLLKNKS